MSTKQLVIEAINRLPEDADYGDISDEIALLAAVEEGDCAYREGRVISNEEMKRRTESWH